MEISKNQLTIGKIPAPHLIKQFGSPLFVYDEQCIRTMVRRLRGAITYPRTQIRYACKANTNPTIMRIIKEEGCGVDTVSPGEIYLALKSGFKRTEISFTGNNCTESELRYAIKNHTSITIDSLSQLERLGKIKSGLSIALRVNPAIGGGHHRHVTTGGPTAKFGIWIHQLNKAKEIARKYQIKIIGLHHHIGSGILDMAPILEAMEILLNAARAFKDLEFVDLGGGYGVPYNPNQKPLDIDKLGKLISERFSRFSQQYGKQLTLMLEPGSYLVCESGILLATVTAIKETPKHIFVGTDSGFNHLIRHPLYNAYHTIINASQVNGSKQLVSVCGNLCETGDLFTHGRKITRFKEGDIVAICNVGAYGYSMSSQYNSRLRPAEVLVNGNQAKLIRHRETLADLARTYLSG